MSKRTTTSLMAAAALIAAIAVPAGAADVEVEFTVEANNAGLSVAVGAGSATVAGSPTFDLLSDATLSGGLPTVTVTDQRGILLGAWALSVVGEDFVNGSDAGETVAASNARIYNDAPDLTALTVDALLNGMALTAAELAVGVNHLGSAYTLLAGTTALGSGSVTVTPAIDITVPAGTAAGTYSGTVTYTVS